MGDRASIKITQPWATESIYLYTHWEGHRICETLCRGIWVVEENGRTDDPSYATRIIFDELTGCCHTQTGFAICIGRPDDIGYSIPEVSWNDDYEMSVYYEGVTYTPEQFVRRFFPVVADRLWGKIEAV